jgi:hypothetical protein
LAPGAFAAAAVSRVVDEGTLDGVGRTKCIVGLVMCAASIIVGEMSRVVVDVGVAMVEATVDVPSDSVLVAIGIVDVATGIVVVAVLGAEVLKSDVAGLGKVWRSAGHALPSAAGIA